MLETFCQVGDVVLVHDESALDYTPGNGRYRGVPQDERAGLVNLVGCQICTSQGKSLGKVRQPGILNLGIPIGHKRIRAKTKQYSLWGQSICTLPSE